MMLGIKIEQFNPKVDLYLCKFVATFEKMMTRQ